ncbi:hypothetical protein NBRC116188_11900 [Oceaniserpentilla sp. 4NH20-0058]|uniref:hypothetical protein n=1 Tax=Oceaniserpentilla sp. 4NH20-0058 TaxID=3127660 RepID=UPI003103F59D
MKIGILIIIVLMAAYWLFQSNQAKLVAPITSNKAILTTDQPLDDQANTPKQAPIVSAGLKDTATQKHVNTTVNNDDSISPEIKQAVKEKLLHNAPLNISKDAKGRTILRHEKRVTHMPVAMKQADGSVIIKEYTHIKDSEADIAP